MIVQQHFGSNGVRLVGGLGGPEEIKSLQQTLANAGYPGISVSGTVDNNTAAAVMEFVLEILPRLSSFQMIPGINKVGEYADAVKKANDWIGEKTYFIEQYSFGKLSRLTLPGILRNVDSLRNAYAAVSAALALAKVTAPDISSTYAAVDGYLGKAREFIGNNASILTTAVTTVKGAPTQGSVTTSAGGGAAVTDRIRLTQRTTGTLRKSITTPGQLVEKPGARVQAYDSKSKMHFVVTLPYGAAMNGFAGPPAVTAQPALDPTAQKLTLEELAARLGVTVAQLREMAGVKLPFYRTGAGIAAIAAVSAVVIGGGIFLVMRSKKKN
jgi:hypothetical protein